MAEIKRLTAIKTRIKPLVDGRFIKQEGFIPSFVVSTTCQRLSRVHIMATVVDKYESEKFASLTVDDGTSTIRAKIFGSNMFSDIKEGNIVDVVGKIREYNGEIYIITEFVNVIDDPNWELLRELEIRKQNEELNKLKEKIGELQKESSDVMELKKLAETYGMDPEIVESVVLAQETEEPKEDNNREAKTKVLKIIEELDDGKGADYVAIIETSELEEDVIDLIINDLLSDGLCFEPKPGKIKKL